MRPLKVIELRPAEDIDDPNLAVTFVEEYTKIGWHGQSKQTGFALKPQQNPPIRPTRRA